MAWKSKTYFVHVTNVLKLAFFDKFKQEMLHVSYGFDNTDLIESGLNNVQ
jgi:hypothetical protein